MNEVYMTRVHSAFSSPSFGEHALEFELFISEEMMTARAAR